MKPLARESNKRKETHLLQIICTQDLVAKSPSCRERASSRNSYCGNQQPRLEGERRSNWPAQNVHLTGLWSSRFSDSKSRFSQNLVSRSRQFDCLARSALIVHLSDKHNSSLFRRELSLKRRGTDPACDSGCAPSWGSEWSTVSGREWFCLQTSSFLRSLVVSAITATVRRPASGNLEFHFYAWLSLDRDHGSCRAGKGTCLFSLLLP
jgi:hypothetical protein